MASIPKNDTYFGQLTAELRRIPAKAARAAARRAFEIAMEQTIQDSGNAAFNWNVSLSGAPDMEFVRRYGEAPVGNKREGRKFSQAATRIVIDARLADFDSSPLAQLASYKLVKEVIVYNPITPDKYEAAAAVDAAAAVIESNYEALLEPAVIRAIGNV